MSTKEMVDSLLRFLEILTSWPVIAILVIIGVRRELPTLISKLADRITKAPGGFEFAVLQQKVDALSTKVERLEQVTFEPSTALTPEIQNRLQSTIDSFQDYVAKLGYESKTGKVVVVVDPQEKDNAAYDGTRLVVGTSMTMDTDVVLREYIQYVLVGDLNFNKFTNKQQAVESGLGDYFPCSYNNDPLFGEKSVHLFQAYPEFKGKPALRNLNNNRRFDDASNDPEIHHMGEIWGGAFWELRQLLGQSTADKLLYSTWTALRSSEIHANFDIQFVKRILETAQSLGGGEQTNEIRAIFTRRGLRL